MQELGETGLNNLTKLFITLMLVVKTELDTMVSVQLFRNNHSLQTVCKLHINWLVSCKFFLHSFLAIVPYTYTSKNT